MGHVYFGCVCDTLMTSGHFLYHKSRWLSLNITVSLATNGICRLCYEEQRLVVWATEKKMVTPRRPQAFICDSGRKPLEKCHDRYKPKNNYRAICLKLNCPFNNKEELRCWNPIMISIWVFLLVKEKRFMYRTVRCVPNDVKGPWIHHGSRLVALCCSRFCP